MPSLPKQAISASKAISRALAALAVGDPVLSTAEVIARRRGLCELCEFSEPRDGRKKRRCSKCGCYLAAKTRLATEQCPVGVW